MRLQVALVMSVVATGCIWTPTNRSAQESTASITLSGYSDAAGQTITFTAKHPISGVRTFQGTTTSSSSAALFDPALFPWTTALTVTPTFWSPQVTYMFNGKSYPATRHAPGRLELIAAVDDAELYTFSAAAKACWSDRLGDGQTASQAGVNCADGDSLVLFDNSGVGWPAETTGWVPDTTPVLDTSYGAPVTWRVGHYTVQGHTVHSLVCQPSAAGSYPVQIINHGGYGGLDSTVALATCKRAAARGWVTAMSAYRGEPMLGFAGVTVPGNLAEVEVCLGEVTDVLRLTELVRAFPTADPSRVLMWGHSHGACITERAVEQGAPVTVAAAFAAPTDFVAWHAYCGAPGASCSTTPQDLENGLGGSPAAAPAAYAWRSPITFAADLAARGDVKFLALQGTADAVVYPSQACALAKLATGTQWHVTGAGATSTAAPTSPWSGGACNTPATTLTWSAGAVPGSGAGAWPQRRYLVVYDNLDHGTIVQSGLFPGFPALRSWLDFENFVTSQSLPLP